MKQLEVQKLLCEEKAMVFVYSPSYGRFVAVDKDVVVVVVEEAVEVCRCNSCCSVKK